VTVRPVLALAAWAALAAAPAPEVKDQDRIQGTWKVVRLIVNGEDLPPEVIGKGQLIFKDDKLTFKDGDRTKDATFTLDPKKTPPAIDLREPGKDGKVLRGIYQLDGDDLKICIPFFGEERPKEFASLTGSRHGLYTLRREK
jgi:uncharacterized protein (TIGR03067 family)